MAHSTVEPALIDETSSPRARPRPSIPILFLVSCGLAAALVATHEVREARVAASGFGWRWGEAATDIIKSPTYYVAHGVQLVAMLAAGILALGFRAKGLGTKLGIALVAHQGAGVLMAARGMSVADLFTTRIADSTGPMITLIVIVALVTMSTAEREWLGALLRALSYGLAAVVLIAAADLKTVNREEVVASLQPYLNVLYWLAAASLLSAPGRESLRGLIRWVPLVVYVFGSVLVQTRLNLVMAALAIAAKIYVSARRAGRGTRSVVVFSVALALAGLVGPAMLSDTGLDTIVSDAVQALDERLSEDTRTHQLVSFFADVQWWELILGRGSRATWNWPGMSSQWPGGTDVGYLSLLFFGGLPLLATYVVLHLVPAFRVLRSGTRGPEVVAATIVALWSVRMASSSLPSLALDYYIVLFSVGHCWQASAVARDEKWLRSH